MKELKSLYNGIMNDYSIRYYSMGWKSIISKLEKRYKNIPKTDEQFTDELVINSISVTKGSLLYDIECFARELSINNKTLIDKYE